MVAGLVFQFQTGSIKSEAVLFDYFWMCHKFQFQTGSIKSHV